MPRYILDIGDNYIEHGHNCPLCEAIDNQVQYIKDMAKMPNPNRHYIKQQIDVLEGMLVNGYDLLQVYEANATTHKFVDRILRDMPTYTDDLVNYVINTYGNEKRSFNDSERRQPTLYFSRFCRDCGARKPDIFDTEQLEQFDWWVKAEIRKDLHSVLLTWNKLDYHFDYTVRIYKKADNGVPPNTEVDKEGFAFYGEFTKETESIDTMIADGRVYYYKFQFIDKYGMVFKELKTDILNKVWFEHRPHLIQNLKFKKHRRLIYKDGQYETDDYLYATYEVDSSDKDFGDVLFKVNSDHVPSLDYFIDDYTFDSENHFRFPNKSQYYFVKPYIRSKKFKKDWDDDHMVYPDLYFWNTDAQAELIHYEPFLDELYDLKFEDGIRSMKISYKLKYRNHVKYVRIMFKQDDKYITDDDDGTYKIVDVPAVHALYDYTVNIEDLASNSYWVFGVFPVYEDSDPDIRLDYQTIVKIRPWFEEDEYFNDMLEFYYTGYWYKDKDFDKYNIPTNHDKIISANARDKEVMMCDNLKMKDVAPLLIHRDYCSEICTVDFDFKMIAKTQQDRLHYYINHKRQLKCVDTDDLWMHYSETFYGQQDWLILRWEQMKFSDSEWTCTFVDNIHIHNEKIIDDKTDNFTREDEIEYTNFHYYNRKIKHNALYLHTPDKYYSVHIKINPYFNVSEEESNRINEEMVVGKPDENFTWMP